MICQIDLRVYVALERVHIVEHLLFIPEMEIVLSGEGIVIAEGDVARDVFPFVSVGHAFLVFNHLVVEVSERLDEQAITYGVVQKMADVLTDEQLRAAGILIETQDPDENYKLTINSPINVKEAQKKTPSRAPDIGENSLEVLRALDFDEGYIQELVNAEVVVSA